RPVVGRSAIELSVEAWLTASPGREVAYTWVCRPRLTGKYLCRNGLRLRIQAYVPHNRGRVCRGRQMNSRLLLVIHGWRGFCSRYAPFCCGHQSVVTFRQTCVTPGEHQRTVLPGSVAESAFVASCLFGETQQTRIGESYPSGHSLRWC